MSALAHYTTQAIQAQQLTIDQFHAQIDALQRPATHAGIANLIELARAAVEASVMAGTADDCGLTALTALEKAAYWWDESHTPAPMTREDYRADQPREVGL